MVAVVVGGAMFAQAREDEVAPMLGHDEHRGGQWPLGGDLLVPDAVSAIADRLRGQGPSGPPVGGLGCLSLSALMES